MESPGFCPAHTPQNKSVWLVEVTSLLCSRAHSEDLCRLGQGRRGRRGSSTSSAEQGQTGNGSLPMGHMAPSHLSAKLGMALASVFMVWYINEMGNLFPGLIITLMFMSFILLLTYNRVQVIKLYVTYAALKSVTGGK